MANEVVIFITTGSKEEAQTIARILVDEKLIACANITAAVQSIFRWQGKVCDEKEALMIVKSVKANVSSIVTRVKEIHSYDVPEIIALPIIDGSEDYLRWLRNECA